MGIWWEMKVNLAMNCDMRDLCAAGTSQYLHCGDGYMNLCQVIKLYKMHTHIHTYIHAQ